jgi:hypothetical protein
MALGTIHRLFLKSPFAFATDLRVRVITTIETRSRTNRYQLYHGAIDCFSRNITIVAFY